MDGGVEEVFSAWDVQRKEFVDAHPQFAQQLGPLSQTINSFRDRTIDVSAKVDFLLWPLGLQCIESFEDILLNAMHGRGAAAQRLMRSMYERVALLFFLEKHPERADELHEDASIDLDRLVTEFEKTGLTPTTLEIRENIRGKASTARAGRKRCEQCGAPHGRITVPEMVSKGEPPAKSPEQGPPGYVGLAALSGGCYLEPTFQTHATAYSVALAMRPTEAGTVYDGAEQAKRAPIMLIAAHHMVPGVMYRLSERFRLGMSDEPAERIEQYSECWPELKAAQGELHQTGGPNDKSG